MPLPDRYYTGKGCQRCNGTGYRGRIGVYELLFMDTRLKRLISKGAGEDETWEAVRDAGTRTMFEDAWDKMLQGITTIDEIISRIPYPNILLGVSTHVDKKLNKKALVFDADQDEVHLIKSTLEMNGIEVVYSDNGDLLELTKKERPSFIIISNTEDRMNLLKQVRNTDPLSFTPIICVSDIEYRDKEEEGFKMRISEFVYRPLNPDKLMFSIRRVVNVV